MEEDGKAVVADFSISRPQSATVTQKEMGSYAYMAPEIIGANVQWSDKADIYSFSIVSLPSMELATTGNVSNH